MLRKVNCKCRPVFYCYWKRLYKLKTVDVSNLLAFLLKYLTTSILAAGLVCSN